MSVVDIADAVERHIETTVNSAIRDILDDFEQIADAEDSTDGPDHPAPGPEWYVDQIRRAVAHYRDQYGITE